ncbi:MAG: lipid-A-disaccharide synthase [Alphaproteobacteria bacterium]
MESKPLKLMVVAGEPSGDALGAQLMAGLKELRPLVQFSGVGGPQMEAQGLKSLYSLADTSVMGLKEVVPKIPRILQRVREAAEFAIATKPDLVILIDSPDFTHRIARRLKRLAPNITVIKYVAPQVWASRPWRAKKLAEFVDHLLALLPFEPEFFERYHLPTHFVGHPVIERMPQLAANAGDEFRTRYDIPPDVPLLAMLPGSRSNEIRFIMPQFLETARKIKAELPRLHIVVPTVAHVRARVEDGLKSLDVPHVVVESETDKFAALRAATAALAASGTVTTEVALAGTPQVVGYRLGWLTAFIARKFFRLRYFTLLNIIADEMIIPEFLQEECEPGHLMKVLMPLMTSPEARAAQIAKTKAALKSLGAGAEAPSRRAARAVLEIASGLGPRAISAGKAGQG